MKPMNQLLMDLEKTINEIENYAFHKMCKTRNAEEYFDYEEIREHCKDLTYHKCQIIDILRKKPF